jgi:hypothetical protein
LVSQDAVFALVIDRPAALLNGAAELWDAADLDKSYGTNFLDFLLKNVPGVDRIVATIDRGRSLALVVLPSTDGLSSYTSLLFLPIKDGTEDIARELADSSMRFVGVKQGYAIYTDGDPEKDADIDFPPRKPLDLSGLNRYPSESIKLWASPAAYASSLAGGFEGFAQAGRRFVAPSGSQADTAARLAEWGLATLGELGSADGAIAFTRSGITLKLQAKAQKGSGTERLFLLEAQAPGALEWAGQVQARALLGLAWSSTPEFSTAMSDILEGPQAAADTPAKAKRALLRELEAKARGPRGAMSFDMGLDQEALASVDAGSSQAEISDAIDRYFHFNFELIGELRDANAYVALLNAVFDDKTLMDTLRGSAGAKGLTVTLDSKHRDIKGNPAGEIDLGFGLDDAAKMGVSDPLQVQLLRAVFDSFSQKFSFRWSTVGGRFAMANSGWDGLAALSSRQGAPKSILADPAFRAFAATMPSRTQYILSISTHRLMSLLKSTLSPDTVDPEEFDCWYGYLSSTSSFGQAVLEAGFFVPAGDIRATIESITAPETTPAKKVPGTKS